MISTIIGPCEATARTFIHSDANRQVRDREREMAHHDLDHVAKRQQQTPSAMRKNSDRNRREYSRLDDQHQARVVAVESHAGENCLDRIDDAQLVDDERTR